MKRDNGSGARSCNRWAHLPIERDYIARRDHIAGDGHFPNGGQKIVGIQTPRAVPHFHSPRVLDDNGQRR